VGMVGFVGAQVVTKFVGFSETSIKNRELRRQNDEMLKHNKQLEQKIDQLIREIQGLIAVQQ
jgi:voltage-gated potassium channel